MPKLSLVCLSFFLSGVIYCQSVVFNPTIKDSLGSDSVSYTVSGLVELNDSLRFQLELVQIYPDSLHSVFRLESGFDQNNHPINNLLQYNPETNEFSIQCGAFNNSDLMVRLRIFRNEETIYETFTK